MSKEYVKQWRTNNPDRWWEIQKRWLEKNEGRIFVGRKGYMYYYGFNHPATTDRGITGYHRIVLWDKLGGRDTTCNWCGKEIYWDTADWHTKLVADHLGPKWLNTPELLVPSCNMCNIWREREIVETPCGFETCDRTAATMGLCKGHYQQAWADRELTPLQFHNKRMTDQELYEAVGLIKAGYTLKQVGAMTGRDWSALSRAFERATGISVREYKRRQKQSKSVARRLAA